MGRGKSRQTWDVYVQNPEMIWTQVAIVGVGWGELDPKMENELNG